MTEAGTSDPGHEAVLARLMEEAERQLEANGTVDVDELTRGHDEAAEEVRELVEMLVALRSAPAAEPIPEAPLPRSGRIAHYRIVRELGRGGMGVVYLAHDERLDRTVALKCLFGASANNDVFRERFRREAKATARLRHPSIVALHDTGEDDGLPYYVMEYVDGRTLDTLMRDARTSGARVTARAAAGDSSDGSTAFGSRVEVEAARNESENPDGRAWSYREAARIVRDFARGLAHAHEHGILHRDVKPSNLVVDDHGAARILDFGVCRMEDDDVGTDLTTGGFVGTLRYMAPEQLEGDPEARSDVYSLGLVLYELLTLHPAFTSESRAQLVRAIPTVEPKRPKRIDSGIPTDLETIARTAYAKLPSERYAGAREFADDLDRFLSGVAVSARPPSALYLARIVLARHKAIVTLAAVAVLALALLSVKYVVDLQVSESAAKRENLAARLAAASAALALGDSDRARRHLEAIEPDDRGWEAEHLLAKSTQSLRDFQPFPDQRDQIEVLSVSPNGELLAVGNESETKILDLADLEAVDSMRTPDANVVAWAPDGRSVVVACDNTTVRVHVIGAEAEDDLVFRTEQRIEALAITPAGDIVLGTRFGDVLVRDANSGRVRQVTSGMGQVAWVDHGRFGEVGEPSTIWCGFMSGDLVRVTNGVVETHRMTDSSVLTTVLATDRESGTAWVGDDGGSIRRIALSDGRTLDVLASSSDTTFGGVLVDHPPRLVTGVRKASHLEVRDPLRGILYGTRLAHGSPVWSLCAGPDGRTIVTGDEQGTVRIWDLALTPGTSAFDGHENDVWVVTLHPDGRRMASGGRDGLVIVWDLHTSTPWRVFAEPSSPVQDIVFEDEGNRLVAACADGTMRVFDLVAGEEVRVVDTDVNSTVALAPLPTDGGPRYVMGHSAGLQVFDDEFAPVDDVIPLESGAVALVVLPNGNVVVNDWDGHTRCFDVESREEIWVDVETPVTPFALARSPDGDTIAVLRGEREVDLVDGGSGRVLRTLRVSAGTQRDEHLLSVAFGPERGMITAGSSEGILHVWSGNGEEPTLQIDAHSAFAITLACDVERGRIASGGSDKWVRLWHADSAEELRKVDDSEPLPGGDHSERLALDWKVDRAWQDFETGTENGLRAARALVSGLVRTTRFAKLEPDVVALEAMQLLSWGSKEPARRQFEWALERMPEAHRHRARIEALLQGIE